MCMSTKEKHNIYTQKDCKSSAYESRTDPPQYTVFAKLDGSDLDDVIVENGIEYERTDHIPIDLDSIPDFVREELARATYEYAKEFYSHPENEAGYQKWLADRKGKGD